MLKSEVTAVLVDYLYRAKWEDVPAAVRHEAKRSLLNFFGAAFSGCRDTEISATIAVLSSIAPASSSRMIGRNERTDMLTAAMVNAMAGNVLDFDDTHQPTILHPTSPVAAALFALAEQMPLSGAQLLHALLLGMEVESRIANMVSPQHYRRGWHITSTCGIFGAAAAAGKAITLDLDRLRCALGIASAQSSGLVGNLGTGAKSVGVGHAARNGLLSSLLAQQGIDGPFQPLEGRYGFLRVFNDSEDFSARLDGLGTVWEIQSNTYKPYPCGVVLNPVIEGCLKLRRELDFPISEIQRVELIGNPLLRERTDRLRVGSGRECQVSAQHAVAVSLVVGRAGPAEFSDAAATDASLDTLREKVRFIDDETRSVEAVSVVIHGPKERRTVDISAAYGSTSRPLSDRDLERKLHRGAEQAGFSGDCARLIEKIWNLDRASSAGDLLTLASA